MTFYTEGMGRQYVRGREPTVDDVMNDWTEKFCVYNDAKIFISTFNVNGRPAPHHGIPGWIPQEVRPDFFIIGLQEMDLSLGTHISSSSKREHEWLECVRASLPKQGHGHTLVAFHRLAGILIVMFKSSDTKVRLSDEFTSMLPTGISVMGTKLGNKGGVGISVKMNDSRICFINSHLAAGNGEMERRHQDHRDITGLVFGRYPNTYSLFDHDVVFWCGDLNYRLALEGVESFSLRAAVIERANTRPADLFPYDQLFNEMSAGRVFIGFRESVPQFRPTYKYDVGTCMWDSSEKARVPAWTDRILWKKRDPLMNVNQISYDSQMSVIVSDHKPVYSLFHVGIREMDQVKADELYIQAQREVDRRANELLPQIELTLTDIDFGEVFYLEPICMVVPIKNVGKSTVRMNFVPPHTKSTISAAWLQVTPLNYTLNPGEEMQISLTAAIENKESWSAFSKNQDKLQDILVLRLEGGRDHFITASAIYKPKVFGVTLEHILKRSPSHAMLIDFGETSNIDATCPPGVPREIHRLVTALRTLGHDRLNITETLVDNDKFSIVRKALENDAPNDLTLINRMSPTAFYGVLLRLIGSFKDPLIPDHHRAACYKHCTSPPLLWGEIAKLDTNRQALIEYLTNYLRELVSTSGEARKHLWAWSDVFFHDNSSPRLERDKCLTSMVDYARDVSCFHTSASFSSIPRPDPRLRVQLPPPIPPHRSSTMPNAKFLTRMDKPDF
ncbi:unnamed protein product, partial [Mesorhabditis spiculigera]